MDVLLKVHFNLKILNSKHIFLFEDGIVWYQMPQGDRRNDIDFIDNSYDGVMDTNILKGSKKK